MSGMSKGGSWRACISSSSFVGTSKADAARSRRIFFENTAEGMKVVESSSVAITEVLQQPVKHSVRTAGGAARSKRVYEAKLILPGQNVVSTTPGIHDASDGVDTAGTTGTADGVGAADGINNGVDEAADEAIGRTDIIDISNGMDNEWKGDLHSGINRGSNQVMDLVPS
ncbi:hypothetical protein BPAE_0366g00040 [Botrytis paeoniae]|uniref:Uncharacterized protein n=1 Tax=Botrytis paeoniae TaxID=278948 RepID=A0A4Z1F799_9HELO|nr:hypothetical protein BPAE_0366g00040 [Botrytis paeoniae]